MSDEALQVIAAGERIRRYDVMSAVLPWRRTLLMPPGSSILEPHLVMIRLSITDSQFGLNGANRRFLYARILVLFTWISFSYLIGVLTVCPR